MRLVLPVAALCAVVLVSPVWGEEDSRYEAERAQLVEQGRRLIQQGSVDYERLKKALADIDAEKAALAGSGGSPAAMDRLAKRAEMLNAAVTDLLQARTRLEDAKNRLLGGRLDAAKEAFNDAVARWSQVHQRIVSHIGEAPAMMRVPQPAESATVAALRQEVQALRAEVQALRAEVQQLRALVQRGAR